MSIDLEFYCGSEFRYVDKNTYFVICDDNVIKNVLSGPGHDFISATALRPPQISRG